MVVKSDPRTLTREPTLFIKVLGHLWTPEPSPCPPEFLCAEARDRSQGCQAQSSLSALPRSHFLGQEAADSIHEVLGFVTVDPVASIRHGLDLGLRKETPDLCVVAGSGHRSEAKQDGVKEDNVEGERKWERTRVA